MSKQRNIIAQVAHRRNSAGPMKHKNTLRGGAKNYVMDALDEYYDELEIENEINSLNQEKQK